MREKELLEEAKKLWDLGDFYGAHEILEDIWRLFPKDDRASRNCYQGLIRLAIAYNHYICGRRDSCLRVLKMSYEQLMNCDSVLRYVDVPYLLKFVDVHIKALEGGGGIEEFPQLRLLNI
ncbi:MAG: DUF309 domain-containing protein [Aquificota bacterium]|nr:MAG: DUF309 domain-containing protein [Aquificota bacterium]